MRQILITLLATGALAWAGAAATEQVHYTARLDGASETPAKLTNGAGSADLTLDTERKVLNWKVTYSGLSGPATMAHFHGPAMPGVAAGVAVPLSPPLVSPFSGTAPLTDGQIGDLSAGLWYLNIHTAKNPGGEIRGQLVKAK